MISRPSMDEWLMGMAEQVALRSSWPGTKVGCVAARDGRIFSTGYNGTPRGWKNEVTKEEKVLICHAEENTIVNAARYGISLEGCTFYMTLSPCVPCFRMLVNVGTNSIVYKTLWEGHDPVINEMAIGLAVDFKPL